ncbi:hypothetical protein GCM10008967_15100 [Bacillus carboniphilus]|uniref:Uncharacterized protein n=1 Tax=Bacillus carboniphilus TaxID=86663 RepID=A0ABP3FW31_9BACI
MGYYLPMRDQVSNQYASRMTKQVHHLSPVIAPFRVQATNKKTREDYEGSEEWPPVDKKHKEVPRKSKQSPSKLSHNQKLLYDLTGKGKYVNECI